MKTILQCFAVMLTMALSVGSAWAKEYEVVAKSDIEFVQHDGVRLSDGKSARLLRVLTYELRYYRPQMARGSCLFTALLTT